MTFVYVTVCCAALEIEWYNFNSVRIIFALYEQTFLLKVIENVLNLFLQKSIRQWKVLMTWLLRLFLFIELIFFCFLASIKIKSECHFLGNFSFKLFCWPDSRISAYLTRNKKRHKQPKSRFICKCIYT